MSGLSLGSGPNKALLLDGGFLGDGEGTTRGAGNERGGYRPSSRTRARRGVYRSGSGTGGVGDSEEGVPGDTTPSPMPAGRPPTDVRGHLAKWPREERTEP